MNDELQNDCSECSIKEEQSKAKYIEIKEARNGYTVRSGYRNEWVAMNIEEVITLVRDGLK